MLKKRYISNGRICKVTFTLTSDSDIQSVALVGDFNNWDKSAMPMKKTEDGSWKIQLQLETGKEYQYRYFVNDREWQNDQDADKFAMHPYGGENSTVVT